ncbi:hypothetical protein CR513_39754, partial [Mucuna pruriens]
MSVRNQNTSNLNVPILKKKRKKRKRNHSSRRRKALWLLGKIWTLEDEDEEVNLCSMAYTPSDDEDDEEEFLSNSSTLSLGYKELKKKISKLSKIFESFGKIKWYP